MPFYEDHLRKQQQFIQLILDTTAQLKALYKIKMANAKTEKGKQKILQDLRKNYAKLKQGWKGDTRYDAWFDKPINNARLALMGVYYKKIPDFARRLKADNYDFARFYMEMEKLKHLSKKEREQALINQL